MARQQIHKRLPEAEIRAVVGQFVTYEISEQEAQRRLEITGWSVRAALQAGTQPRS